MEIHELPSDVRTRVEAERKNLRSKNESGRWTVRVYNAEGTRCLTAYYMPEPRNNHWIVRYGVVQLFRLYDTDGRSFYEWRLGRKLFTQSANGTKIPRSVKTKKDVLALIDKIGIFK